ncbi:MAG: hypothetical protein O6940_14530 [Ignavibacteria bacterium]|nr:hypothetical protein [Ignavibacteria bacterium]
MGDIVFWTIMRTAIIIPAVWVLRSYIDEQLWLLIGIATIYGIIIHPAILSYRKFETKNKELLESSLCSTCKHFDPSAVLCLKHDKHPTENYIPCEGEHWEPK